jgi:hypothetical protein
LPPPVKRVFRLLARKCLEKAWKISLVYFGKVV